MNYLFIHGWKGSEAGHWQRWLAAEVAEAGHRVAFPELPEADRPDLRAWSQAIGQAVQSLTGPLTVIAHSLGARAWLQAASRLPGWRAEAAWLVAPIGEQEVRAARSIRGVDEVGSAARRAARETTVVFSRNDPFCAAGADAVYARPLGFSAWELPPNAGHINVASGFGPWPAFLERLALPARAIA